MGLALGIALSLGSGYLFSIIFWPRRLTSSFEVLFCISLSTGLSLGLSSVVLILERAIGIDHLLASDVFVFLMLAAAYALIRGRKATGPPQIRSSGENERGWLDKVLFCSFPIVISAAIYSVVLRCVVHPHGEGWDAFSIWNLHARFLFRGGAMWRDGFTSTIAWSHPDYPLLLPGAIAHFWTYLRHETQAVPTFISLVFTFATAGLLFSSLAIVRGSRAALLGTMVLASTPFFVEQGTSQYADVPLSFFFLAALSLLLVRDHLMADSSGIGCGSLLALSGVAAGFAAWTKNEGLLFVFALAIGQIATIVRSKFARHRASPVKWIEVLAMFIGLLPMLLLIVWFKHGIAPPGDLFPDRNAAFQKLADMHRYWIVFNWFGKELFRFGNWLFLPATIVLPLLFMTAGKSNDPRSGSGLRTAIITIGLTLAGYFAIYVITPHDLYWHLRNSLGRLFLQVWPSAILVFFAALPTSLLRYKPPAHVSK